jgi:ribose transport system substrate-binding protein
MSRKFDRRTFLRTGALAGLTLVAGCSGGGGDGGGDGGGGDGGDGGSGDGGSGDGGNGDDSDNGDGEGMDTETEMESSGPPRAALSIPSLEFTFFTRMENAFEQVKSNGDIAGESTFFDAQNSQSTQVSDVETALTNDIDFLMISPVTADGIVPAIQQANEQGVPVIAIDRNIGEGAERATYVASDNVSLGQRSTNLLLEFMTEASDADTYSVVQLEGTQGASVTNERGEGFQNAVDENDNLERLASQTGEFSTQAALNVMEDFITQYGEEIDGVFCQNDLMALGVHQALQNNDMSMPITGIDGSEAWVQLFGDNPTYGTIAQLPEEMVNSAIARGKDVLAGESVEDTYSIDGLEVTQENASDYLDSYF